MKEVTTADRLSCSLFTGSVSDQILINENDGPGFLKIKFYRTIRVPDNDDTSALPPDLGCFPLYPVANFQENMPQEMLKKGGVFLPMYQKEAMWISFQSSEYRPFAVTLFSGGVNAISGKHMKENVEAKLQSMNLNNETATQDYMVTPQQVWLDGYATEDGTTRQFIAMPLGQGYSVEAQITKQEIEGGLQFLMTPQKKKLELVFQQHQRCPGVHYGQIFIRQQSGDEIVLEVSGDNTIDYVKAAIEDKLGIPIDQQRLILNGKRLEDGEINSVHEPLVFYSRHLFDNVIGRTLEDSGVVRVITDLSILE